MNLLTNPTPEKWYLASEYYPTQSTEVMAIDRENRIWIDIAGVEGEWGTGSNPDFAWKIVASPNWNELDN